MKTQFDEMKLTGNLPSPSGVGIAILRLTQTDEFSADELAKTIQSDPALTGRIVKMANSAQASGVTRVTNVAEAVVRLGIRTVRNVALGFSLVSEYRNGRCASFDYGEFWSKSLARAVAAQTLARELRLVPPADAYLCGLLSGIGKLALATVHPKSYSDLWHRAKGLNESRLAEAEQKVFGIDHLDIARAMFEDWRLPPPHGVAVHTFPQPAAAGAKVDRVTANLRTVLRVAVPIADLIVAPDLARQVALWPPVAATLPLIDADRGGFFELCDSIAEEWKDWGGVLSVPARSMPACQEIARQATENPPVEPSEEDAAEPVRSFDDIDPAAPEGGQTSLEKMKVLAVDDDPVSLRLLITHLKRVGYEVIEARDGAEALTIALEANPHLVVSDWSMPEMDGLDLCRSLRKTEIGRDMYILLLTGREDEERVVEAFDAGVDDFVTKPFNPKVLLSRVAAGDRLVRLKDKVSEDKRKIERQVAQLAVLNRKLKMTTITDALTNLPNRRHALETLETQWQERDPSKADSISVIMIDIDHFKSINDNHGHDTGDVVLRQVAEQLEANTRGDDTVCRLGGEEFVVICPGADIEGAAIVAERLRTAVERHVIRYNDFERSVTCSFGVAQRSANMSSIDELLKAADVAVYRAKNGGRNQVCAATR